MPAGPLRIPVVFFGHGGPMNAIQPSRYADAWRAIGARMPRPRAIPAVSAHWYTCGTGVTAMAQPRTNHDFYDFPQPLWEVQYPATGDPDLARRAIGPCRTGLACKKLVAHEKKPIFSRRWLP